MNRIYFFTALLLCSCWLKGAEFFVSPDGSDNGKGDLKSPFKTIQKGVSKVKAGDILTILPGTYREAVKWHFDGDPAKKTTVRAKIPGSVLIHGDRAVTGFKAVPNRENCYELPCPQAPQGVNECDTLVMYKQDDTMLNTPYSTYSVWSYDDKAKKIYSSTSSRS